MNPALHVCPLSYCSELHCASGSRRWVCAQCWALVPQDLRLAVERSHQAYVHAGRSTSAVRLAEHRAVVQRMYARLEAQEAARLERGRQQGIALLERGRR